ncbi:MAG: alanine--tRNA ligase, partial [Burkholderiaceae bacterium]|nr:alanine--tRNA ligase [Burkholderiaceae bacterium]
DRLQATIRIPLRQQTMRNHSATHLMHKALRQVLGEHVAQRGSLVDAEKTRFDFSHHAPLTPDEIVQIEKIVNEEIVGNQPVLARVLPYDEAIASGAVALFGEKYGDSVRVLNIGFSCELCGGTHVSRTGDIGLFKIASEGGVAAGVRRVEAVTGMVALEYVQANARKINDAASALKTSPDELVPRILQMQDRGRTLERELSRTREKAALGQGSDMLSSAVDVEGIKVLAVTMNGMDAAGLRNVMDKLKDRLKTAAIVLATVNDDKVSLIAGVTSDVTNKIRAGDMVNHVARQIGGKGGGRPDMAQAGGNEPSKLPQALDSVVTWVRAQLTS